MVSRGIGIAIAALGGLLALVGIGLALLGGLSSVVLPLMNLPASSLIDSIWMATGAVRVGLTTLVAGIPLVVLGGLIFLLLPVLVHLWAAQPKKKATQGGSTKSRLGNLGWGVLAVLAVLFPFSVVLFELFAGNVVAALLVCALVLILLVTLFMAWLVGGAHATAAEAGEQAATPPAAAPAERAHS
jgi:hypothetical protein